MTYRRIAVGNRYGILTVVGEAGYYESPGGKSFKKWLCQCDCGSTTETLGQRLNSGHTTSCGCVKRSVLGNATRKHGEAGHQDSAEYTAWCRAISRCSNPNNPDFHNYGARGICVADRWRGDDGFKNFLADVGRKPSPQHSLDRIDFNGNYEPGNCRWATSAEQSRNRRNSVLLTHDGVTLNLVDWAKRRGLARACLAERLKLGWSVSEALGFTERAKYGARSRPFSPQVRTGAKK